MQIIPRMVRCHSPEIYDIIIINESLLYSGSLF